MNFFLQVYCIDFAQDQQSDIFIYILHAPHTEPCCDSCVLLYLKQESLFLLDHGAAVLCVLVGGGHLAHVDSDGGQDAVQLLHGLLRQGGLPAQDPGELHAEQAEVGAAVDQRVTQVVSGEHPVGAGGGIWRGDKSKESKLLGGSKRKSLVLMNEWT